MLLMTSSPKDDRRAAFELLAAVFCADDPGIVDECLLAERDNDRYCAQFGPSLAAVGVMSAADVRRAWRAFLLGLRRRDRLASLDWSFGVDDVLFNFDLACARWLPGVDVRWSWRADPALQSWTASKLLPKVARTLAEHGLVLIELVTGDDDIACVTIARDAAVSVEAIAHVAGSIGQRARAIEPG